MTYRFNETPWQPREVLAQWEMVYGTLDEAWREKFLGNPITFQICQHHPAHIRRAIAISKKLDLVLSHIRKIEIENEARSETMLDELRPSHAVGITNAHLGNRTTDPFDLQRDDLLFRCSMCNLKLSIALRVGVNSNGEFCKMCHDE